MTNILIREKKRHPGRVPCGDRSRYYSDASVSQRMTKVPSCHQKLEKRQGTDSPSESSERTNHADLLISDLCLVELRQYISVVLNHQFCDTCYSSPRNSVWPGTYENSRELHAIAVNSNII